MFLGLVRGGVVSSLLQYLLQTVQKGIILAGFSPLATRVEDTNKSDLGSILVLYYGTQ